MQWTDLWTAIALVMVIEGLLPLLAPGLFKRRLLDLLRLGDVPLRVVGVLLVLIGLVLLSLARG